MSSTENLKKCSIGNHLEEECHLTVHTRSTDLKSFSDLTAEQVKLISMRTGISTSPDHEICLHHEQLILTRYSYHQRSCCNPFNKHQKQVKGSLREVSLDITEDFNSINISVIPGKKICPTCRKELTRKLEAATNKKDEFCRVESDSQTDNESDEETMSCVDREKMTVSASVRHDLDTSFEDVDLSPIKLHGVPSHSKVNLGKRKLQQFRDKLKEQETTAQKRVAKVIGVIPENLDPSESSQPDNYDELKEKADNLDRLVDLMKSKMQSCKRKQKIQILTIAPSSWSIEKTKNEFNVSAYMVRQARKLVKEKGILELPGPKKGKGLSEEIKRCVADFYCDDEYSRLMPGKKDCVSIARNVHKQKRLLLCDLKELYTAFKKTFPLLKVGFSKFCSLRPKWCVLVGCSGTHSVCVCTIHQNVVLMMSAVNLDKDHHELMDMMVCCRDSKQCMIHRCPNCPPDTQDLENYLFEQLQPEIDDEDDPCTIQFQQWTNVDRSEMVQQIMAVEDFISLLVEKLNTLTAHSYIAKAQAKYLKKCKEELKENEVIVLGDFAENYQFVVQDEIQGFHWNKQSATLHPIVLYYMKDNKLMEKSLCYISDDLNHDTCFVYEVIKQTVQYIKAEIFATPSMMRYFSDGCAGQYKNYKNFINLCLHEKDFNVKCEWSFFATSHGKSPCDGLGGTLKRLTARASLQRTHSRPILTAKQVFEYCNEEVKGVHVIFISSEEMVPIRSMLDTRFSTATTLPGTRSFHQYTPLSESVMAAKRVSEDELYALEFNLVLGKTNLVKLADPNMSDFIVCSYDEKLWVGLVDVVDKEHDDVQVKFMHPSYPARSFSWPRKDDVCFVPIVNVACIIGAPVTVTGRQYKLSDEDIATIEQALAE